MKKRKQRKKITIHSKRMVSFLIEGGLEPCFECEYYSRFYWTPHLSDLMDRYYIIYTCIPNRL